MRLLKSSGKPRKTRDKSREIRDKKRASFLVRRVRGESMYPVLEEGRLIVVRSKADYQRGDIIVFEHDGMEKVKRVAGVEGNFCFVLGDNPSLSIDSRSFGYIGKASVLGKVVWPRGL